MKQSKPRNTKPPLPTACISCGEVAPTNEPLEFRWDCHRRNDEMVLTCSRGCRKKCGIKERKMWPVKGLEDLFDA